MIPDLGSQIQKQHQKRGVKKNVFSYGTFYCSHKFHKIVNYFFFNAEEKNVGQFLKNYRTFTQKIVNKLSKISVWDPGSGIRKKLIPDPGSRGQKGTGSRIRNTADYIQYVNGRF